MLENKQCKINFLRWICFAACRRKNRHQTFCHRPLNHLPTKVNEDAQISLFGEVVNHQIWHNSIESDCNRCEFWLQIYESENGGEVQENDLAAILEIMLGVKEVELSGLFLSLDNADTKTIAYGEIQPDSFCLLQLFENVFDPKICLLKEITDTSPLFTDELVRFIERHPCFVQNYLGFNNHPRSHCIGLCNSSDVQSKKEK